MRVAWVLGTIGRFLRLYAWAFLPPLVLALADGELPLAGAFAAGLGLAFGLGALLARGSPRGPVFRRTETLAVVAGAWFLTAVLGAVPLAMDGLSPVDALFESMSGFTTTGATVLRAEDFAAHGRAFFLWRGLSQWLGGLGVITLFVLVLPQLGIGGRQLFFAEISSAPGERISPQTRRTARALAALYVGLTAALTLLLLATGLPPFDAVVHAFATLSAGGYSPKGASILEYGNPAVEWVLVPFMLLAGVSFVLQWKALAGRPGALFGDGEFRAYLLVVLCATLGIAVVVGQGAPGEGDVRAAAFQVTSLVSSTGFASADYDRWPDAARVMLVAVMAVCACAGSAGGGPKVVRLVILSKFLRRELRQALHPSAVVPITHGRRPIASQVLRSVVAVVVLFVVGWLVVGSLLVLLGADLVTGFTAAVACLNNVGPGLGEVGPMGSYAGLPAASKVVLTFAMWFGRLEILTVLVLLHPDAWRHLRWRGVPGSGARAVPMAEGLPAAPAG